MPIGISTQHSLDATSNSKKKKNANLINEFQKLTMEDLTTPPPSFYSQFMGVWEENLARFLTDQQRRWQKNENCINKLSQIGYEQIYLLRYCSRRYYVNVNQGVLVGMCVSQVITQRLHAKLQKFRTLLDCTRSSKNLEHCLRYCRL